MKMGRCQRELIAALLIMFIGFSRWPQITKAETPVRTVYVPYFGNKITFHKGAIFWFGRVNQTSNYADVRVGYMDDKLVIRVTSFDRLLWYDTTPTPADLTQWDAVSLYFNTAGNSGSAPTANSYRFVAQLNHWQPRQNYQTAYQGNGVGWAAASFPFETDTGWRGSGLNSGTEARGWNADFFIPYASLGLTSTPSPGTTWGLALALHDRDDATTPAVIDQTWPEPFSGDYPSKWGQLVFGLPNYVPPISGSGKNVTIRHKLDGATVTDAHVGGHTTCGSAYYPDFFNGWGDANYAGYDQINIQNQSDVADWPCFSKFYVTFPLESLPAGQNIISATLSMHQFGNSDPAKAQPSLIQVLTVAEDWNEAAITWNNAPLPVENVARSWVDPLTSFPGWPGVPAEWDVSQAVADAYVARAPLQLVLYSADGAYHSGKYFISSDTGDWNAEGRPTLRVLWGTPTFSVTPSTQAISPGESATYTIHLEPSSGFTSVALSATSPSPYLSLNFSPKTVIPPGDSMLTISDSRASGTVVSPAELHTIPIVATGNGATQSSQAQILIGGLKVFLPLVVKNR